MGRRHGLNILYDKYSILIDPNGSLFNKRGELLIKHDQEEAVKKSQPTRAHP